MRGLGIMLMVSMASAQTPPASNRDDLDVTMRVIVDPDAKVPDEIVRRIPLPKPGQPASGTAPPDKSKPDKPAGQQAVPDARESGREFGQQTAEQARQRSEEARRNKDPPAPPGNPPGAPPGRPDPPRGPPQNPPGPPPRPGG
jgi:hypothetical protein